MQVETLWMEWSYCFGLILEIRILFPVPTKTQRLRENSLISFGAVHSTRYIRSCTYECMCQRMLVEMSSFVQRIAYSHPLFSLAQHTINFNWFSARARTHAPPHHHKVYVQRTEYTYHSTTRQQQQQQQQHRNGKLMLKQIQRIDSFHSRLHTTYSCLSLNHRIQ